MTVGCAFAFEDTGLPVGSAIKAPVEVRKRVGMIRVLVHISVVIDPIAGTHFIEVGSDRFQEVTHLQLQSVGLDSGLHAALLDHPELQRRGPGAEPEDRRHVAAAHSVGDVALRPVRPAFQPALVAHPRGIAENDRGGHQYSTAFARS